MKFILMLLLFLSATQFCSAQTGSNLIKGVVKDSVKNEPLMYVTISLQDVKTGAQLKTALSKEDGSFEVPVTITTGIKLVIASLGYEIKTINLAEKQSYQLGTIRLKATSKELNEVTVSGTRPIIKQEVDRISYDVQNDQENKVLTVLDMLRKVPMVSVDAMDGIKLKGSGNYKILINGKESSLTAKNPADIFRSMPASNIQKIEVITTPPAKYDAEGIAGIINIITKKDITQGYNVGINTRYNTVNGPGININGTMKQGKFGLNGYFGTNQENKQTTTYGNTNHILSPAVSYLLQDGRQVVDGKNSYGNAELSYEIDTLNLITSTFQHNFGTHSNNSKLYSNELNADLSPSRTYDLLSSENSHSKGTDLGFNYQLGFKRNKEQLLTASYKYTLASSSQFNDSYYVGEKNFNFPNAVDNNYRQYNNSGSKEHTFQLDYVHPLKLLTIEAGAKGILRNNYSDFDNYNQDNSSGEYITDLSQTNHLDYQQDVFSIYNSYQLKLKDWVMKGGLRLENTNIDATFEGLPLDQSYYNLVPSLSVQRSINSTNSITMGITNRIQRPGIDELNPFINRSNPRFITTGNPDLQPVTNHSFELNYSNFKKGSFNVGLSYAYANNTVESVLSVSPDTVTTTTFANVGKNRHYGIDVNANYPITKKLTFNANLELLRVSLSGTYAGQFYNSKGYQGHAFTYTSYKFDKGYTAGVNIGYDSRYVMLQGRDNEFFFYSGSASKEILNKKGTISLSANMPFRKYKHLDFYNNADNFRQTNYVDIYSRRISVSFNYKFGRLNGEIKKNSRGINNDDLGTGSRQ